MGCTVVTRSIHNPILTNLSHHGVLGMKWGHRKRKETILVSKAREVVSKEKLKVKQAQLEKRKQTKYGLLPPSSQSLEKVRKANLEYKFSKQDVSKAKILDRLNSKDKTTSQLSMEEKYKQKGMSNDEAAVAAYQHLRTKKILTTVGAVALTAAVAYGGYKFHDARVDKLIKSGTLLQNISTDSTTGIRDAFYSSKHSLDNMKYAGMYGGTLENTSGGAFKKQIQVLSDIRQASHKNAQDTLSQLMKSDPEFASGIKKYLTYSNNQLGGSYARKLADAEDSLAKGIVDKHVYEAFNASLVDHSPEMQKLTDKFYNSLSSKGYNAIKDINDSKYSGYKTLNPIIAFNTTGKVNVISVQKLAADEINKSRKIAYASIVGSDLIKQGAVIAGGVIGTNKAISTVTRNRNQKLVTSYLKAHPGTKLTNTEIVRNFERGVFK